MSCLYHSLQGGNYSQAVDIPDQTLVNTRRALDLYINITMVTSGASLSTPVVSIDFFDTTAARIYAMASRREHIDDQPSDGGRYVVRRFTVPPKNAARNAPEQGQGQGQRIIALDTDDDSTEDEEAIEANIGHARNPSQSLPPHPSHSRSLSNKNSHIDRDDRDDKDDRQGREDRDDRDRHKDRDQPSRRYTHVSSYNQPAGRDTLVDGRLTAVYRQRPQHRQDSSPRRESSPISHPSSSPRRSGSRDSRRRHAHGSRYHGHKHRHERRYSGQDALAWDDPGDNHDGSSVLGLSSFLRRVGISDGNHGDVGKHNNQPNTAGSSGSSHTKRHSRQHGTGPRKSRWADGDGDDDGDKIDQWDVPSSSHRRYYGSGDPDPYHARASSSYADRYSQRPRLPSPNQAVRRYDDDDDDGWDDDCMRLHRQSTRARSVPSRGRRSYSVGRQGEDREDHGKDHGEDHRDHKPHGDHKQRQERKSTISAAAKHAVKAGAMAALSNAAVPGDWLGEKGSRVVTAALGAALVDTFMSHNYPTRVNGIRHTAMRQVAERTIKSMVTEPIFQRAAQHRGNRDHGRSSH